MIKRIKEFGSSALSDEKYRKNAENFESELLRGISTLIVLKIIKEKKQGAYGYQILKELENRTDGMLILEEGTLYPMLRKLEKDGMLKTDRKTPERKASGGRKRKYYTLSEKGTEMHNLMLGFFAHLVSSIGPITGIKVNVNGTRRYCENCTSVIGDENAGSCPTCGYPLTQE